jgi:CRP/FNR family transcriptional regulator, cyclic AMP receptor protein
MMASMRGEVPGRDPQEIGSLPPFSRSSGDHNAGGPNDNGTGSLAVFERLLREVSSGELSATSRSFAKGEIVFREGDLADGLHIITGGQFAVRCELRTGSPVILAILGRPDIFGEFGVFASDHRRTATVLAMTSARTVMLPESLVKEMFNTRPDFAAAVMQAVVHKGDESKRRLIELVGTPAKLRILRALLELSGMQSEGPITITQSDLASLATTTRVTANQVLQQEQQRGTLLLSRGRVRILDVEALTRRARLHSAAP